MLGVQTQFLGGGKVGAAGQTGQVNDERPARQLLQKGPGQHRRGDCVDDGVKAGQQCGQGRQGRGAAPGAAGIGALLGAAGGHGDAPAQQHQPPCYGTPDAAIAQHEKAALPDRALPQAEQQLKTALGGGHGVQAFQLGPQKIIDQRQPGLPRGHPHRHPGAAR